MKNIRLQSTTLGLSCVENYTLSILKQYYENINCLFCMSFISAEDLLYQIVLNNIKRNNFKLFPRIHEIAFKYLSLIHLHSYDDLRIENIWSDIKNTNNEVYYLIKVNPSFVKDMFHVNLLRKDHYICCYFEEDNNIVFNDYPYKILQLEDNKIIEAYDGNMLSFKIIGKINDEVKKKANNLFCRHIDFHISEKSNRKVDISQLNIGEVKEFLILYKKIVQRTALFCSDYQEIDSSFLRVNALVDNSLTQIYMDEVKKRDFALKKYQDMVDKLLCMDRSINDFLCIFSTTLK